MRVPCSGCGRLEPKQCGKKDCPYFAGRPRTFKQEFSGQSPNIFVGRHGYPNIRVGILATENYTKNDDPRAWSAAETPIPEIVDMRSALINSQFTTNIRSFKDRFLEQAQLIAQGIKETDMEVRLEKAPTFKIDYPQGAKPHGASVKLVQSRLTENVKIPRIIDKVVSENELKATEALTQLQGRIDEHALTKLMTGGLLGTKRARKLVPTRWSITAVDDTLGKNLLEDIRAMKVLGEPLAYFGGHYGNYYCILFFPRNWQYELFEFYTGKYASGKKGWTDYESYAGRTNYAEDTAGGYYAARVAIAEFLKEKKWQATVLCLRFITDEYTNPLGVWVVRDAVRKALATKPIAFATEELLIKYAIARCHQFGISYPELVKKRSLLLRSLHQRTLADF